MLVNMQGLAYVESGRAPGTNWRGRAKELLDRQAAAEKASESIIQVFTVQQPPADLLISITPRVRKLAEAAVSRHRRSLRSGSVCAFKRVKVEDAPDGGTQAELSVNKVCRFVNDSAILKNPNIAPQTNHSLKIGPCKRLISKCLQISSPDFPGKMRVKP